MMRIKTKVLPFVYRCPNCEEDIKVDNVLELAGRHDGCKVTCENCKNKFDVDVEEIRVYLRSLIKALEEAMDFLRNNTQT